MDALHLHNSHKTAPTCYVIMKSIFLIFWERHLRPKIMLAPALQNRHRGNRLTHRHINQITQDIQQIFRHCDMGVIIQIDEDGLESKQREADTQEG